MAELLVLHDLHPGVWERLADDLSVGGVLAAELVEEFVVDESRLSAREQGTLTMDRSDEALAAALMDAGWTGVGSDSQELVLAPPRPSPARAVSKTSSEN